MFGSFGALGSSTMKMPDLVPFYCGHALVIKGFYCVGEAFRIGDRTWFKSCSFPSSYLPATNGG